LVRPVCFLQKLSQEVTDPYISYQGQSCSLQ